MSQWAKRPVGVPFGPKCSVDVPLVDVLSMHYSLGGRGVALIGSESVIFPGAGEQCHGGELAIVPGRGGG